MPGKCEVSDWLWEALTNYRLAVWRLGIVQCVTGSCCVLLGGIFMMLNKGDVWAGLGIWSGIPFVIAGACCIIYRNKKERKKGIPAIVMSTVSAVISMFLFITCIINIHGATENLKEFYPYLDTNNPTPVLIINSFLLVLAVMEAAVAVWAASLLFGVECHCFALRNRDGIFTIPYDTIYDEPMPPEPRGMLVIEGLTSDRLFGQNTLNQDHEPEVFYMEDPMEFTLHDDRLSAFDSDSKVNQALKNGNLPHHT